MQECLVRLWRLERSAPGQTRSWYLQNCRFHLQRWLASGKSVDSLKRDNGDKRITIDGASDELPANWYHTNGELLEAVVTRDIVSTLSLHLKPRENEVLGGLADGLVLRDIARKLEVSYPTALKSRRRIAAVTIKLGICPPPVPARGQQRPSVPRPPAKRRVRLGGATHGSSTSRVKGVDSADTIRSTRERTSSNFVGST